MASLQKTYSGDLTTAIAGKLYEAIKDADEKNQLDKTNASEDVKKEAVKVKKEDPESIPVRDMDLRKSVVDFFTPIDGKLLKTQATSNTISAKVTALAGGVADTQKLLINQNQLLEDKFDQILSIVGTKSAIDAKLKAENDFKQLELNLEKGLDLSGTFAYDKAGGRSSMGILGSVLQGILGNRMTARLVRNLYKKIVPKGLRARGRLLRKTIRPFAKASRFSVNILKPSIKAAVNASIKAAVSAVVNSLVKIRGSRALGRAIGRVGLTEALPRAGGGALRRSLGAIAREKMIKSKFGKGLGKLGLKTQLFLREVLLGRGGLFLGGRLNADRVANEIINAYATRATLLMNQSAASKYLNKTFKGLGSLNRLQQLLPFGKTLGGGAGRGVGRKISKKFATSKSSAKVATNLAEDVLGNKGLFKYLKNPVVQKKIAKKIGQEGLEKLLAKSGVSAAKNLAVGPGTIYSFVEGLARMSPLFGGSDPTGMLLSFGSAIPFAGWGVIVADILRDIDREAFDAHILPNLFTGLSEEDFQNFFTQALGLDVNQFERGTPNATSNMLGNPISDILGVTQAFGEATGFGAEVGGLIGEAGLNSYPTGASNYNFDVSGNVGGGDIQQRQNKEIELKEKEKPVKEEPDTTNEEESNKPGIGERISNFLGETTERIGDGVQYIDEKLDFVRQFTGGERGDGVFSFFGLNIPNIFAGGGDSSVVAQEQVLGGDSATIEFYGQQGRDLSGEPGVDFSFKDYKNNYNLFPGYVLETGLLYGSGYGNVVVVRSVDPSNGKEFDSLYSHFPDGGIAVKAGQQVSAGQLLGAVGFVGVDTPGVPQLQPNNAGNMSGWHTSVDFFEPGSAARYSNADALIRLVIGSAGSTPDNLLERLKPSGEGGDTSSLNSIEANNNLASTMTNMVENGSSERLMTKRKVAKPLPIVIINNQTVNTSQNLISFGGSQEESNFFEAYNLARHTV